MLYDDLLLSWRHLAESEGQLEKDSSYCETLLQILLRVSQ